MLAIPVSRRNAAKAMSKPRRPSKKDSGSHYYTRSSRPECEILFGQEREFPRSVPIVLLHPKANSGNTGIGSHRRCKVTLQKSRSTVSGGGAAVVREHCSDDVRDIFELDTKEECKRRSDKHRGVVKYSSDNENVEQNGLWGSRDRKFQAEVLRAECSLLRMEKDVAVNRREEGRAEMEHAVWTAHSVRSAVQTLVTVRKGIADEKSYAGTVLQTNLQSQIEALQDKLQKLQKNSEFREYELRKCAGFDCQALLVQSRLHKLRKAPRDRVYREDTGAGCSSAQSQSDKEENAVLRCRQGSFLGGQQVAKDNLRTHGTSNIQNSLPSQQNHLADVAMLRRMNESKEIATQLKKEYRAVLGSSGNCSSRRMDTPERAEQGSSQENKLRSEHCKPTIWKIIEQVQAETQQWSRMQEILHYVREEMEELQKSKDFWEDHALHADEKIAILQAAMHEWRQKARSSENKVLNLQSEVIQLRNAVEHVKERHAREQSIWLAAHTGSSQSMTPSISAKSSRGYNTDCENLDHHEAYVDGSEMSNQSGEREKVDHPTEYGKDETKNYGHVLMGSPPMGSERTSLRICKATQSFHVSRHHQPLINKTSKLNRPGSCPQLSSMHFQQNDCVAEHLSGDKFIKKVHIHNSKKNITVQNRHSHRENIGKWDQMNGHHDHLGSGKSSIRLPLADIENTSPFRIQGAAFPLSRDGII